MRSVGSGSSVTNAVRSTLRPMRSSSAATRSVSALVRRRFCATVRSGSSAGSWKTGASPTLRAPLGEPIVTGLPSTVISPESRVMTPVRIFTSVDLPAPLAPMSACTSPGSTLRSAERSATTGP